MKYKNKFKSCSAFSPIVAPSKVKWGEKAFGEYLGNDKSEWFKHDACNLVENDKDAKSNAKILIDQGLDDVFLKDQLKPELFEQSCKKSGQELELRLHEGYDHGYFFIQSFIEDHLDWHFSFLDI